MKEITVLPCRDSKRKIKVPEIELFKYLPELKDELDKNLISKEDALRFYRAMIIQRAFEYTIRDLDNKRLVPCEGFEFRGSTHLSVGQEAAQTGAICALTRSDYIAVHHRAHGHCLAKGLFAYDEMDDNELKDVLSTAEENEFSLEKYDNIRQY